MARETRQTETATGELTSGQLVIMICVALFLAALFFALGQLVARLDFAGHPPSTEVATTAAPPTEGTSPPAPTDTVKTTVAKGPTEVYVVPVTGDGTAGSSGGTPAISSPPPSTEAPPSGSPSADATEPAPTGTLPASSTEPADASPPASPGKMLVPPARRESGPPPSTDTVVRETSGKRRLSEIPPLPSPHRVTPTPPPEASPAAVPIKPLMPPAEPPGKTAAAPAAAPAPEPTATVSPPVAGPAPAPTGSPPADAKPEKDPTTSPAKASDASSADSGNKAVTGKFGVQLASFTGSQADLKAEQFLKKVEKQLNLPLTIIKSADGKYCRVVVTGYADRAAASEACARIRKTAGLSEAFVRPLE
ncbi:MAG: SPOR domain-containing protein [Candidatus Hydrogenedentes bacterium]|nr:SPOR domain-containing protein [Candidatus Hydrogenedentota bacterium]